MGKNSRSEGKPPTSDKEYLSSGSYAEFLWKRLKNGGIPLFIMRVYKKIRKYTLFTAVIRVLTVIISLLEKSAILLLLFSVFLLLLPVALIPLVVASAVSIFLYFRWNGAVKNWILQAETVTVYVTSEHFFGEGREHFKRMRRRTDEGKRGELLPPLFVRCAMSEAAEYSHPVIVVCSDPFLVARWAGLNLLTVKIDYFFILRQFYFNKKAVSYLVL